MVPVNRIPSTTVAGLINSTWEAIGNPRFKAVLEAWLAMANDPSLRAEIGPVVAEFASLVKSEATTSIPTDAERRDFFITAREAMLGLALGRATNGGNPSATNAASSHTSAPKPPHSVNRSHSWIESSSV